MVLSAVELARELEEAKAAGRRYVLTACPGHDDRKSSLMVFVDGRAKCLAGCHEGQQRPITDFWSEWQGGGDAPQRQPRINPQRTQAERHYREVIGFVDWLVETRRRLRGSSLFTGEVRAWLQERCLSESVVSRWVLPIDDETLRLVHKRFGIQDLRGYALRGGPGHRALLICRDASGNPIWHQLVATTEAARERGPKYTNPGGVSPKPFGWDTLPGAAVVVVTEGTVDALSALDPRLRSRITRHQGKLGVLAIPGVANAKESVFTEALRLAPKARWVVACDADQAGESAARRVETILKRHRAQSITRWRPSLPGVKDLNAELQALSAQDPKTGLSPSNAIESQLQKEMFVVLKSGRDPGGMAVEQI